MKNDFFKHSKEIFNYTAIFEETKEKIPYEKILVEDEENIFNYCIVVANDGFYYLGEIHQNKTVVCWAKFQTYEMACQAL